MCIRTAVLFRCFSLIASVGVIKGHSLDRQHVHWGQTEFTHQSCTAQKDSWLVMSYISRNPMAPL